MACGCSELPRPVPVLPMTRRDLPLWNLAWEVMASSATVLIKSCYYAWKFVQEVKIHAKAC